jgi:chromate reductase, NAD(P)H dehydrogenase (quinone)
MGKKIKILGIAGSLRKASFNRGLLRYAMEVAGPEIEMQTFDLGLLPMYNSDLEAELPKVVVELKQKIKDADAILLVTPEYNYSISGVLKNALEWGSRPWGENSWEDKPVAITGAGTGSHGTARAQYQLRQMFVDLNMLALTSPELMVPRAEEKFDENGNLTDEKTKQRVQDLLVALVEWTKRLQKE